MLMRFFTRKVSPTQAKQVLIATNIALNIGYQALMLNKEDALKRNRPGKDSLANTIRVTPRRRS